jgi:long-subunit acyl-CoA synthetase (AMP-forming)
VLAAHNVGKNDKVSQRNKVHNFNKCNNPLQISIISNNRIEWATAMYAANGLGAHVVPMYEAQVMYHIPFHMIYSSLPIALVRKRLEVHYQRL